MPLAYHFFFRVSAAILPRFCQATRLLRPFDGLQWHPVSTKVGNVREKGPELVERVKTEADKKQKLAKGLAVRLRELGKAVGDANFCQLPCSLCLLCFPYHTFATRAGWPPGQSRPRKEEQGRRAPAPSGSGLWQGRRRMAHLALQSDQTCVATQQRTAAQARQLGRPSSWTSGAVAERPAGLFYCWPGSHHVAHHVFVE